MTEQGVSIPAAAPLRADAGERRRARTSLALLLLLVLLCLSGPATLVETTATLIDPTPLLLDGARYGVGYYEAVADAFRFPGAERPIVWAVPLPGAVLIRATLPDMVGPAFLWALSIATFLGWYGQIAGPRLLRKVAVAALLASALAPFLLPAAADRPESWAALLAALALALRSDRAWLESAALGCGAGVLSIAALPLLLAVAVADAWQGRRREATAWAVASALAIAVLAFHLAAVLRVVPEASLLPRIEPVLGLGPLVAAARETSVLGLLPFGIAATLVAGSLWAWAEASDIRVLGALAALALALILVSLPIGPLLGVPLMAGLALMPRALVRRVRTALARERRITVRRVVR